MEILNSAPCQTLPQNCRNDTRENTPEGFDLRIKEYLDSDLRTANIITDVLESVGIASNVNVRNPESGREIKGSRLNQAWCWPVQNLIKNPKNLSTLPDIRAEIAVYRNSLRKEPVDEGTWRTYEAALLRMSALAPDDYNLENRRRYDLFCELTGTPNELKKMERQNRIRHSRVTDDEVESYLERYDGYGD